MRKLETLWGIFKAIVTEPGRLRLLIDQEKKYSDKVRKKHPAFAQGLPVIDISEFLSAENSVAEPYTFLGGNSLPTDLALLRALAKQISNCRYFEIGTWRGESVANVASVAAQCTTLNLPDEAMRTMGAPQSYIDAHRFFSKNLKNVTHLQHDSLTFDFNPYKNKMDLVFVDGDHHYREVKSDTENVFNLLYNEFSIIVWHDYGFDPEHVRYEVLAGILDGCPAEKHSYLYHVSDTKCAVFIQKKFKTTALQVNQNPDKHYSVSFTEKKLNSPCSAKL